MLLLHAAALSTAALIVLAADSNLFGLRSSVDKVTKCTLGVFLAESIRPDLLQPLGGSFAAEVDCLMDSP